MKPLKQQQQQQNNWTSEKSKTRNKQYVTSPVLIPVTKALEYHQKKQH